MKKIIFNIIFVVLLAFTIPILFTSGFKTDEVSTEDVQENTQKEAFDYGKYNTIKLLHKENNMIDELALDEYLYGVVAAEMPANYNIEALKAQATVARTYTIYKIANRK